MAAQELGDDVDWLNFSLRGARPRAEPETHGRTERGPALGAGPLLDARDVWLLSALVTLLAVALDHDEADVQQLVSRTSTVSSGLVTSTSR